MLKTTLKGLLLYLKKGLQMLWKGVSSAAFAWPKAFAAVVALLLLSYYPLGGYLSENIDKTTDYKLSLKSDRQSETVEMMAFLINREVNENLWTANLPMFFPSYFLDNMPNYQRGIIQSLAVVSEVIAQETQCAEDSKEKILISEAAKLLNYPTDVWLFSPENKLKIAPSSASQYRKARKMLRDYNAMSENGACGWAKDEIDLRLLVGAIKKDLNASVATLENQVTEHSTDWFDSAADDIFYRQQGKIYAYMVLLKAAGLDFKRVLLDNRLYEKWTQVISVLENGVLLSPSVVVNAEPDSLLAANHLMVLGYYTQKAVNLLDEIEDAVRGETL